MQSKSFTSSLSAWFVARSQRFLPALVLLLWAASASAQMKVNGKGLYDPNGERIIARGVENSFGIGLSEDGRFIDEIAKTGANAIRILPNLAPGQLTLAQIENLIAKAKGYGMIVYISPAPPIPAGSSKDEECWKWFERDDVYAMLGRYKDFIIIDGVQEHTAPDANVWVSYCKAAIDRLRRKGYTVPLLMMSNDYGRNHETILNKAAEVFNYDPLKNTFFNVQAYWDQNWSGTKKYSTELIQERIPQLAALNYCVQIGITPWAEGAPCDNGFVDYKTAMAECQKYNLGWLVWDWHNPYEWSHVFSVTTSGVFGEWNNHCTYAAVDDCRDAAKYGCDYGYQVCIGHANSIQKTSVKTCFMRGNVNCGGTTPPPVTLRNPENPASTVAGLDYKYYEGTWTTLPNFSSLTAVKSGTVTNFDLTPRNRNDNFAFQYTGFVNVPTDGTYTFYTSSDDGSKLLIGTTEVVNNDGAHATVEKSGTIGLKAGKHALTVTYFEATGGENLTVSYAGPGISKTAIPASALFRATTATVGTGLRGEYFNNRTLTAPSALVRTDATVNFQWWDPAGPGVNADNFSVRWTGQVEAPASGSYTFSTVSDDGVRLWVNGVQVVNNWTDHGETTNNGTPITLTGGQKYNITMEFYDAASGATARLLWAYPGQTQAVVPQARLYPAASARMAAPEKADLQSVTVYPNPTHEGYLSVKFVAVQQGEARVSLVNALGRAAVQRAYPVAAGENTLRVSTAGLGEGIYFLHLQQAGRKVVRKVAVGK